MATYTKQLLSGSTNGKNMQVTGINTGASILIHTAVAGTTDLDEIWLYATNTSAAENLLSIEFGAAGSDANFVYLTVPVQGTGLSLLIPGLLLQNGMVVKAYAATANTININGFVNRITA
tara:strand:- start:128 stop:487 length:360 start_codon:yes stop_codon:yes gene_type:complete